MAAIKLFQFKMVALVALVAICSVQAIPAERACECKLTANDAPENGGLICHLDMGGFSICEVKCNPGYDFPSRMPAFFTCAAQSAYQWTMDMNKQQCVEEFFPGLRMEGDDAYFVVAKQDLSQNQRQQLAADLVSKMEDSGYCSCGRSCNVEDIVIL